MKQDYNQFVMDSIENFERFEYTYILNNIALDHFSIWHKIK